MWDEEFWKTAVWGLVSGGSLAYFLVLIRPEGWLRRITGYLLVGMIGLIILIGGVHLLTGFQIWELYPPIVYGWETVYHQIPWDVFPKKPHWQMIFSIFMGASVVKSICYGTPGIGVKILTAGTYFLGMLVWTGAGFLIMAIMGNSTSPNAGTWIAINCAWISISVIDSCISTDRTKVLDEKSAQEREN